MIRLLPSLLLGILFRAEDVVPQFFVHAHPWFDERRECGAHELPCRIPALGEAQDFPARIKDIAPYGFQIVLGSVAGLGGAYTFLFREKLFRLVCLPDRRGERFEDLIVK